MVMKWWRVMATIQVTKWRRNTETIIVVAVTTIIAAADATALTTAVADAATVVVIGGIRHFVEVSLLQAIVARSSSQLR